MTAAQLRAQLGDPYLLAVNLPYVVAFLTVVAETTWRAVAAGPHVGAVLRPARTAVAMAAGALVVGTAYSAVLRSAWSLAGVFEVPGVARLWAAHPAVAAVAAFVAWDLAGFAYHWLGHFTQIGWASHQPHHLVAGYDLTLGLRQSWTPVHGLLVHPLLAVAGFELRTVVVCASLSGCWQVLLHTARPVRLPRLVEAVVMTPATHRHHHSAARRAVNLGPVLTLWDRMAGSFVPASVPSAAGLGSAVAHRGVLAAELDGWRELLGDRRR